MAPTSAIPQTTPTTQPNIDFSQFGNYSDSARQAIQSGASLQDVQNAYQKVQQQPQQPQQAQGQQPSWWEKLLPTAGGAIGGILGGLVPIPGLDVATGIGGAAAGGAIGQKIENMLTGQKQSTLAAGAENALGQGAGMGLGFLGKGVANAVGGAFGKGADALVAGQAKGFISPELANDLRINHGITNLAGEGQKIANVVTGSSDSGEGQALINKAVENGIFKNGPQRVDLSDLTTRPLTGKTAQVASGQAQSSGNMAEQFMTQHALTETQKQAVRSNIAAISDAQGKTIAGATDGPGALSFNRRVGALADQQRQTYLNSGLQDQTAKNLMNAYQDIQSEVNDRLFSPAGQGIAIPQTEKDILTKDIQTYVGQINPKAATAISNDVQNAKTYSDLRSVQAKWVTVNRAVQTNVQKAAQNYGVTSGDLIRAGLPVVGAMAGGGKGAIVGAGLGAASKLGSTEALGAKGFSKLAGTLSKGTNDQPASVLKSLGITNKNAGLVNKITPLATRATALGTANLPNVAGSGQPTGQITQGAGMQGTQGAGGAGAPGQDALNQLYNQLLQQEQSSFGGTQTGSLISALNQLAPQVNKQQIAANAIQQLIPAYQNAGGAQGLLGGLEQYATGLIPGTAANVYGNQQQATAGALGGALGISPAQAGGLTPQLMSNQQTANPQITALQNLLSMYGGGQQATPVAQ